MGKEHALRCPAGVNELNPAVLRGEIRRTDPVETRARDAATSLRQNTGHSVLMVTVAAANQTVVVPDTGQDRSNRTLLVFFVAQSQKENKK